MRRALLVLSLCGVIPMALAQEIQLEPVSPEALGGWAQAVLAFRLHPTLSRDVNFSGPALAMAQWGDVALGSHRYAMVLGVRSDGEAGLWVDRDRDGRITPEEAVPGLRGNGRVVWKLELLAAPAGGAPYPLTVVWPEGRGYVYLVGGAPRRGELVVDGKRVTFVLVDGDLDGVFGTKDDFYAVDGDGDGVIHGDPDGHERFTLGEAFTVGKTSFGLAQVSPSGSWVLLAPTAYVPPKVPLIPGHPAPDFRFSTFPDGKSLALSEFKGKVVLLDFWATWCGPCMQELPHLKEVYERFRDQGFEIVGVSLDTSERDLRAVLSSQGIRWPLSFEGKSWDNPVAELYRVYQIPTSFLIDRRGVIRFRDPMGDELERAVAELLAEPRAEELPPEAPPVALPEVRGPPKPILEVQVPTEVGVLPGGDTVLAVKLANTSPYLAEELRVRIHGPPEGITAPPLEVGDIPPFGERTADLTLTAAEGVAQGNILITIDILYHYCIGDSCFQMSQAAGTTLAIGVAPTAARRAWSPWWLLLLLGVGVVVGWFLWGRGLSGAGLVLLLVAGAALAAGVFFGQSRQAQLIGAVLCTSCVGIEEVHAELPVLSREARATLAELARPVHLVVFHAPWCRSCPYAISLVEQMAQASPFLEVELVDAEEEPARAEAAGVSRSGRLVVPAILVVETSQVLFGTHHLGARLLALLREAGR
ncbi:MAG: redoxin domain-containing protein [Candidatus Acetothermia bacterium]|nr:redoxin domain-containing protein [Candidatus Acetothermia bacterium]